MPHRRCTEVVGPVWQAGGESCACILPASHVFALATDAHEYTCGTWWYDREQIERSRREREH